jgi:hypothetical protein
MRLRLEDDPVDSSENSSQEEFPDQDNEQHYSDHDINEIPSAMYVHLIMIFISPNPAKISTAGRLSKLSQSHHLHPLLVHHKFVRNHLVLKLFLNLKVIAKLMILLHCLHLHCQSQVPQPKLRAQFEAKRRNLWGEVSILVTTRLELYIVRLAEVLNPKERRG